MKPESIEFLPAQAGEPLATQLLYGLTGVTRALEVLTCQGEDDRDLIGNLATAADCLARLLNHRMGHCPAIAPKRRHVHAVETIDSSNAA